VGLDIDIPGEWIMLWNSRNYNQTFSLKMHLFLLKAVKKNIVANCKTSTDLNQMHVKTVTRI
jgi:hypothetical protein